MNIREIQLAYKIQNELWPKNKSIPDVNVRYQIVKMPMANVDQLYEARSGSALRIEWMVIGDLFSDH